MPTYPSIGTDFERTFRTLKELPCDIFLGAHASYFDGRAKAARLRSNPDGPNPFVDPGGCRAFVERAEARFLELRAAQRQCRHCCYHSSTAPVAQLDRASAF
jgi:metallo-beta-lactamase class B